MSQFDVILKLGGSLLDWPEFPDRLRHLLKTEFADLKIGIVVGGGPTANIVREWDRIHNIGEEAAHWIAIESLDLNTRLVRQLLPEYASESSSVVLLLLPEMIREIEASGFRPVLPHTWNVTSDSIAFWIAAAFHVKRLVLVKSVVCPDGHDFRELVEGDLVDTHFSVLMNQLDQSAKPTIEWVNLRSEFPLRLMPVAHHSEG